MVKCKRMNKGIRDFGKGPHKLNLGCGNVYLAGHINIDKVMPESGKVDLLQDICNLSMFSAGSCSQISAYHVIEHLPRRQVLPALKLWHLLLKNEGELVLELPDFDRIAHRYLLGDQSVLEQIFGNQKHAGQFHYWGYSPQTMRLDLEAAGFKQVKLKDPTDYHASEGPCMRIEATKLARTEFHLETTNCCTRKLNRCAYCADDDSRQTGYLDLDLAGHIVDQIASLHSDPKEILLFLSGEPLLHKSVGQIIRTSNRAGTTVIHTNADVLNRETAFRLIDAPLGRLHVNLHLDPLTGSANLHAMENLRKFLHLNNHRVHTVIQGIVPRPHAMPKSDSVREDFPGADEIRFRRPHNWASQDSIAGAMNSFASSIGICRFLQENVAITWNGEVLVCCADLNGEWVIGDLKKEPLRSIDLKLDEILARQRRRDPIPELCSKCERYKDRHALESENGASASRLLKQLLKEPPDSSHALPNSFPQAQIEQLISYCTKLRENGRTMEALRWVTKMLKVPRLREAPDLFFSVVYQAGSICEERGRLKESLVYFESILQEANNAEVRFTGGALFHMAAIHERRGDKEIAVRLLRQCLDILPHHAAAAGRLRKLKYFEGNAPSSKSDDTQENRYQIL
jgi:predicted SAM-dependent methyltransferase/tetratricopeptide (TPR) repeat protein